MRIFYPYYQHAHQAIHKSGIQLVFLYLFAGCTGILNFGFDCVETFHFQPEGSGKSEFVFSLQRAAKLISLGEYMAKDHMDFARLLIRDAFLNAAEDLKKIPGIHAVSSSHDNNMLSFKLYFNFKNMAALNKAMAYLNSGHPPETIYFKLNNKEFISTHTYSLLNILASYKRYDDTLTKSFDLAFFIRKMRYISRYSFKQKIKKATHPCAKWSKGGKDITIIQQSWDIDSSIPWSTDHVVFQEEGLPKVIENNLSTSKEI